MHHIGTSKQSQQDDIPVFKNKIKAAKGGQMTTASSNNLFVFGNGGLDGVLPN